eukprot:scaffold40209_cov21-Tisochrysis_lutea.AAC.3
MQLQCEAQSRMRVTQGLITAGLQGFAHCALCFMNMSTDNVWIWTGMDCFAHTHDISGSGHYLSIDYQLSLLNSD